MTTLTLGAVEIETASGTATVEAYVDPKDLWNGWARSPYVTTAGVAALVQALRPGDAPDEGDARVRPAPGARLSIAENEYPDEPYFIDSVVIDGQIVWPLNLGWCFDIVD